jgi:hypothetical protein
MGVDEGGVPLWEWGNAEVRGKNAEVGSQNAEVKTAHGFTSTF